MAEPTKSFVSQIHLDKETRERILKELQIPGSIDWIPDTIHIVRPQVVTSDVEATEMATSSLDSWSTGPAFSALNLPASTSSSTQYDDSSASSSTIPIFEMKSAEDFARQAAR